MRILFVNYHHLDSNSGAHIFYIANQLTKLGVQCIVCVPYGKEKVEAIGQPLFEVVTYEELLREKFARKIDLIHAWTPREIARKMTIKLVRKYSCPYFVHLEDNEELLLEIYARAGYKFLKKLPLSLLDMMIRPHMSHPVRSKEFLKKSSGATIIIERLSEYIPPHIPRATVWAGYQEDMNWDMKPDIQLRKSLGITEKEFVVAYTGNVHLANYAEVTNLYQAVDILIERKIPVKLIRTGINSSPRWGKKIRLPKGKNFVELGHVSRSSLPSILSIADVLVQPGRDDRFNAYRFPSKLPEYLASGKPVILPRTNIGLYLKQNDECVFIENGDSINIADKLELLFRDQALRSRVGDGGRKFAEINLKWQHIVAKLLAFYQTVLAV